MTNEIKLLGYNNPYWQNNPKYFLELLSIVEKQKKSSRFVYTLQKNGYKRKHGKIKYYQDQDKSYLLKWIIDSTNHKLFDSTYTLITRVNWIINGITTFPICPICKNEHSQNRNLGINMRYPICCSRKCLDELGVRVNKMHLDVLLNRNGIWYGWDAETRQKRKQKNLEVFGAEYYFQTNEFKIKSKRTSLKNHGVCNGGASKQAIEKSKLTKLKNHNDPNYTNVEQRQQTCLLTYGYKNASQSPLVKDQTKKSNQIKYGVDYFFQSDIFKKESRQTYIKNYGVENPSQCPEIRRKQQQRYLYNGIGFDSAPEIALYIWLTDHQIQFEYQPDISFDYEFKGRKFRYFPDFKVEDQLIELKGDHFFSKDGKMVCPYRQKSWSDEKYLEECEKYEAKHQCMILNNVQIWTSRNYSLYLQYVRSKYGNDFLPSLKK